MGACAVIRDADIQAASIHYKQGTQAIGLRSIDQCMSNAPCGLMSHLLDNFMLQMPTQHITNKSTDTSTAGLPQDLLKPKCPIPLSAAQGIRPVSCLPAVHRRTRGQCRSWGWIAVRCPVRDASARPAHLQACSPTLLLHAVALSGCCCCCCC